MQLHHAGAGVWGKTRTCVSYPSFHRSSKLACASLAATSLPRGLFPDDSSGASPATGRAGSALMTTQSSRWSSAAVIAAALGLLAGPAGAETVVVSPGQSIQSAIAAAASGDV